MHMTLDDVMMQDGNVWTSSGVSAGMDMTMCFIDKLAGSQTAKEVVRYTEYNGQWTDSTADNWADATS